MCYDKHSIWPEMNKKAELMEDEFAHNYNWDWGESDDGEKPIPVDA